jgi:prolyl-tRNA synthetase
MPQVKREKWSKKFGEWYRKVLIDAELMDYRYPIKGCGVWLPYGFKVRRNTLQVLRDLLDATGHHEALFPLMIPETSLMKESTHVKSFEEECYWVTHGGTKPLEIKYALRPTSETAICPMLKLWIRSHKDLPLKLYQIVNVFRYETKATRPTLRMREVSTFKEAHTSHATFEDAEAQVKEAVEIYRGFFDALGVSYCITKRPEWDKFPGALYSIAFDTVCPDSRSLQIGTVHNLGQNFSKAFEITYETENGNQEHIWQTCYGISERGIAAMLTTHGDDNGIVLPPRIAPMQVIIIPIPHKDKEKEEAIIKTCKNIAARLKKAGINAKEDLRPDVTPGSKYYDWELRGVPIRIEIGPRDLEKNEVTIVRRDTFERQSVAIDKIETTVNELMEKITVDIQQKAWQWMSQHIYRVNSLEEASKLLKKRAGIIEALWCGNPECGHKLEEEVNARVLGTPQDLEGKIDGRCVACGGKAKDLLRAAIAY